MEKRKKWTAEELFRLVDKTLMEKGLLPQEILDYGCAGIRKVFILSEEFEIIPRVSFGGSEGIYLDIVLEAGYKPCVFSTTEEKIRLGTYKTLSTDRESYRRMSLLGAEFVCELRDYVAGHMDEFNWTGFDVTLCRGEKPTPKVKYWVLSYDKAVMCVNRFIESDASISFAVIRNNATGHEETIQKPA